jgi:site-specific DNA recombinase
MYGTKTGKKCVVYIRVSSERQVKGYSLDGQKHYLKEWAERQGMSVLAVYVEEGKSGKSIEGRTEFQKMLESIQAGTIDADYVIVFKLSRFGRNAKDILNSLELIMRYGVHLLCIEDGLDSSTAMGKMMITILGAVAEMERENIIAQSYLGREEKAKSGGWNGGFAPYGYRLSEGKLVVEETEGKVVKLIFQKFVHENMSYTAMLLV